MTKRTPFKQPKQPKPPKQRKQQLGPADDAGLDLRARLVLARILREEMRLARRSKRTRAQFWINDDACAELELQPYDEKQFNDVLVRLEMMIAVWSRRSLPRTGIPWRIADLLGASIELSLVERDVLAFALLCEHERVFSESLNDDLRTLARLARIAAPALGMSATSFMLALDARGTLSRCGFISLSRLKYDGVPTLHDGLTSLLRSPPASADEALRAFVELGNVSRIERDDVDHVRADIDHAVALLRAASAKSVAGVNVLLWGPPGTGKTETARLIAREAQLALGEVPVSSGMATQNAPAVTRLGSYELCQRLLAGSVTRGVVLFDELEDVQPRSSFAALHGVAETKDKGMFTRLLEENVVPTIWTTNHVNHIDSALLRRFDLVIEMKVPPERVRRRMVDKHLASFPIAEDVRARLAADDRMAPAIVARAARVAALVEPADVGATVQRVVDGVLRVVAGPKRAGAGVSPIAYDVAFANASIDVDTLARAVSPDANRAQRGVRACLYGPPGAGKTAFVRHAAERAGRRLIVKRMSDLLSCWVGATEQAIARMFEEARDEDAVLLLDEADGLLRSREGAQHSWEVTQTNELLTQMESFDGAFFCATNLVDALDHAAFRRFDVKVRFDPLTRAQRIALYTRVFADVDGGHGDADGAIDDVTRRRIDRLEGLCAGHFAAVARRLALMDGRDAIAALEEEHRFVRNSARVGFVA